MEASFFQTDLTCIDENRRFQREAKTGGQSLGNRCVDIQGPHARGCEFLQRFPSVLTPEESSGNTRRCPTVIMPIVIITSGEKIVRAEETNEAVLQIFELLQKVSSRWTLRLIRQTYWIRARRGSKFATTHEFVCRTTSGHERVSLRLAFLLVRHATRKQECTP